MYQCRKFLHDCSVERYHLFLAIPTQPTIPLAGLGPAIHAFFPFDGALGEDVGAHGTSPWADGPRNKSGHGGSKVVHSAAALSYSCSKC